MRAGIDCDYTDHQGRPIARSAHVCVLIRLHDAQIVGINVYSSGPEGLTSLRGHAFAQLLEVTDPLFYSTAAKNAAETYQRYWPELATRFPIR